MVLLGLRLGLRGGCGGAPRGLGKQRLGVEAAIELIALALEDEDLVLDAIAGAGGGLVLLLLGGGLSLAWFGRLP